MMTPADLSKAGLEVARPTHDSYALSARFYDAEELAKYIRTFNVRHVSVWCDRKTGAITLNFPRDLRDICRQVANAYYHYKRYNDGGTVPRHAIIVPYSESAGFSVILRAEFWGAQIVPNDRWWLRQTGYSGRDSPLREGTIEQYLGDSHELSYCAYELGIPLDVVRIIEFEILMAV